LYNQSYLNSGGAVNEFLKGLRKVGTTNKRSSSSSCRQSRAISSWQMCGGSKLPPNIAYFFKLLTPNIYGIVAKDCFKYYFKPPFEII
jgi:hypothetical protein